MGRPPRLPASRGTWRPRPARPPRWAVQAIGKGKIAAAVAHGVAAEAGAACAASVARVASATSAPFEVALAPFEAALQLFIKRETTTQTPQAVSPTLRSLPGAVLVQQLLSIYNNMKIPNTMCLSEGEKALLD